ncbi:hypothetical protein [Arthrobacter sp.]|uniref:hypothetical protein n=1 Tax=Arthrobacter sp. TaxID=1667 RepID=UPI003399EF22
MRILNINSRYTTDIDVALPFDTDAQMLASWDYIVTNRRADSFRYDPGVDGDDPDRAWMSQYLANHRAGTDQPMPDPDQVRRSIAKLWGAEMNYDFRELIGVEA